MKSKPQFLSSLLQFFVSAAALLAPLAANATLYYNITGGSINSSDWSLTDTNGHNYLAVTKPSPVAQAGMTSPWVDSSQIVATGTSSIGIQVDSNWPADTSSPALKKMNYRIVTGNGSDAAAAGVKVQNDRFVGFWVRLDPGYELNNGAVGWPSQPIGTQLWQCWQGSGWPPLQLRTDESGGQIRLYFLMSNDHCRGSQNSYSSIVYIQNPATGTDLVVQKGQWYPIIVEFKFDWSGSTGAVNAWVNGVQGVTWTGQMGYKPASVTGGQAGALDFCDSHFGIYEQATTAFHKVWYDNVKWASTYAEANPGGWVTLPATADSYVASNATTTNYGTATQILTKTGSPTRKVFAKFDTSSIAAGLTIDSATLTYYGYLSGSDALPSVDVNCYAVSDNSWTETGVTWANQPTLGAVQGSADHADNTVPRFLAWNATTFVRSQRTASINTISLALVNATTSQQNTYFNSREMSTNVPGLTVYFH